MDSESDCEYIYDDDDADDMGYTDNADYDSPDDHEKDSMEMSHDSKKGTKSSGDRRKSGSPSSSATDLRMPEEGAYRIVDEGEVQQIMGEQVRELAELLDINFDRALVLLHHFRWRKERTINGYYDNPDKVEMDAGLAVPNEDCGGEEKGGQEHKAESKGSDRRAVVTGEVKPGGKIECKICYDPDVELEDR